MFALILQSAQPENIAPVVYGMAVLLVFNSAALFKISYSAGQWTQRVISTEQRLDRLEAERGCAAEDCALHTPRRKAATQE